MKPTIFLSLLISVPAIATSAASADTPVVTREQATYTDLFRSSAFTLVTENDKYFAGTDRHYTNGLKLSFLGTTRLDESPDFIQSVTKLIPTLRQDATRQLYKVGVSLGQNIYTPVDTSVSTLIPNDRPYAGWLYASLDLQAKSADGKTLRVVEIAIGIVGPSALGRQTQNGFHDIIHVPHAEGWHHQLRDEPGLQLSWERRHRLLRFDLGSSGFSTDFIGRYGLTLGNVRTHAAAGGAARIGFNLPMDFGADLIRPSGGDESPAHSFSAYLFGSSEASAIARNIFLDGNTWKDSHSVDKRDLVVDFSVGLVMRFPLHLGKVEGLQLAYTQNYRTKEFHGQLKRDVFGSIALSVLF